MHDYTQMTRLKDQETPHSMRMDYPQIISKLIYVGDAEWTFITCAPSTRVAERLKRASLSHEGMDWGWTLETFTRRMRPNRDGSPGYEIWARIEK